MRAPRMPGVYQMPQQPENENAARNKRFGVLTRWISRMTSKYFLMFLSSYSHLRPPGLGLLSL